MKKIVIALLAVSALSACSTTKMTPAQLDAWHAREAQRAGIEQGKAVFTQPSQPIY